MVTASDDLSVRLWDVQWATLVRGEDLVRRICSEKLVGSQEFTPQDAFNPILSNLTGTNPCQRVGTLVSWLRRTH